MHGDLSHVDVGHLDHDAALLDVRVFEELADVVDGRGGDLGLLEEPDGIDQRASLDEAADDRVHLFPALHALGIGFEGRILIQIVPADGAEEPLRHGLGGRGDRHPAAVARGVYVAG